MDTQLLGGVPLWFFLCTIVVSILLGRGIRIYLDNRKIREAERLKQRSKEIKKEQKRLKKLAKKGKAP